MNQQPDRFTQWHSDSVTHSDSVQNIYREGALQRELAELVAAVLREHQPQHITDWERCMSRLCRRLRAMPELKDVPVVWFYTAVKDYKSQGRYLPPLDKVWDLFQFYYPLVHTPIGDGSSFLEVIQQEIDMDTDDPLIQRYHGTIQRLVRVCVVLQRMAGDQPFFLSCRVAGELCGVSHMRTARLLIVLVRDRVIRVVEKGKGRNATTYRLVPGHHA